MTPQPQYADGGWETSNKFVWGPEDKLLLGHWTVLSTARDLEEYLGEPLTRENVDAFRAEGHGDHDMFKIHWELIDAGLRRRGIIAE